MKRHKWQTTDQRADPADLAADQAFCIERCTHCESERVPDIDRKTQFLYRGGKALRPRNLPLPQDGRWVALVAGVIPTCVERP